MNTLPLDMLTGFQAVMKVSGRTIPIGSVRFTESTRRATNLAPGLLLAAAATIACAALQPVLADCPRMCDCKWKSGKESVMCLNANLTRIPRQLDAGTQLLDLTGNALEVIRPDAFADAGLLNLQKLFLARCRLHSLDRYAFRKLINLVELDLSHNALSSVPSASLETIPDLRELRLNDNPIHTLPADGFKSVPQLVRLDLSSCKVNSVVPRSFAGLEKSLELLKLDRNQLSVVSSPAVAGLLGLHGLELAGNPWNCSCALRPLREWMQLRNLPSSTPPTCKTPQRLAGLSWKQLNLEEFACTPSATAASKVAAATEGNKVTLRCLVRGVPNSEDVQWLWKGMRPIANLSGSYPSNTRRLFVIRTGSNGSNLTIISVEERDAGVYVCRARNRAGEAEANVTLSVERRPSEEPLSGRLVVATLTVAILLVTASCLVALCVCRLRKQRQGWTLAPFRPRESHEDNYEKIEMNHKKPDQVVKSNGSVDVGVVRPMRVPYNRKKNGWYRGVSLTDEDEGGYEAEAETPTPTTGSGTTARGSPWTTNQQSPQESRRSHSSDGASPPKKSSGYWKQRPDSLRCGSAVAVTSAGSRGGSSDEPASRRGSFEQSSDVVAAAVAAGLPQHVLRKQVLSGSGGSLYTSLLSGSEDRSFSDFLVLSPLNQEAPSQPTSSSADSNVFCTLPRRQGSSHHQPHRYGSESPLLPDSRYGSSGGSSNSSHRAGLELPSISSSSGLYYPRASSLLSLSSPSEVVRPPHVRTVPHSNPSLPGSPSGSSVVETPILKALGKSTTATHTVPGSSGSFDSSSGVYEGRTSQLDKFLDEYHRLHDELSKMKETCDSIRRADGITRPPRSILKNKNAFLSPEASASYSRYLPPYWLPRDALMKRISGNDFFES